MLKRRAMAKPRREGPRFGWLRPNRYWLFSAVAMLSLFAAVRSIPAVGAMMHLPEAHRLYLHGALRHTPDEQVFEAVKPFLGVNLVALDIDGLYQAMHDLPWVSEVKIRRRWPDGVWVELGEREAIARWGEDALISPTGEIFSAPMDRIPQDMVQLHGPKGTEHDLLAAYASTRRQLAAVEVVIQSMWIDPRGAWHLRVNNDLELRLGRHHLKQRVERFMDVVLASLAPRLTQAQIIDMRYGNGFAVNWRPQTEEKETDVEET